MISSFKVIGGSSENQDMSFEEQSFVVVGASRVNGIGFSFVKELLAVGVKVKKSNFIFLRIFNTK